VYAKGQSGLIFNQAPGAALRVRVPPPPPTIFHVGRSSKQAERRAVTADVAGSSPVGQPSKRGALAKPGKARDSLSRKRGFKSRTPRQTLKDNKGERMITTKGTDAKPVERLEIISAAEGSLERQADVTEKAFEISRPPSAVPQP
jgi:hypothetical protein